MNITITKNLKFPADNPFEVVERKGIGHPDTVADSLAEKISVEYSKYCLEKFGIVLHHNVDKLSIMGGLVDIDWAKGEMIKPIRVLINGRLSASFDYKKIPIDEIYTRAITEQLLKCLPGLDTKKWLKIIDESTSSSKNPRWFNPLSLTDVPDSSEAFANDTSAVVSYWPLTPAERVALELEGYFYNNEGKPKYKEFGQDIKVMIVRRENSYDITMCVPFFAKYVSSSQAYWKKLSELESDITIRAREILGDKVKINLKINAHDQRRKNQKSAKTFYFVVAGSALDFGEEGVVGRGNNRLGIIPSFRPYTMEAAPGKNPVYHVGKVLGVVSDVLAKEVANKFNCRVEVWIITRNADPLFEPHNIIVNVSGQVEEKKLKNLVLSVLEKRDWTKKIVYDETIIPRPGNKYLSTDK